VEELDTSSRPSLRERKQERVRTELINAAMALFLERGFDATTVDDIADAAQVGRRTLFRYFESKGDIVMAWTRGMTDVLAEALAARPADEPPMHSLREAILVFVKRITQESVNAYEFTVLIERTPSLRLHSIRKHAEWEEALSAVLAKRLPKTKGGSRRAALFARIGVAAFRTALDEWIASEGRADLAKILVETFRVVETVGR